MSLFFPGNDWRKRFRIQQMPAIDLQSSCTPQILSFYVLCSSDVETVRSLVQEMKTDSTDEMTDDSVEQGIGKRVIGELLAPKKGRLTPSTVPIPSNFT